MFKGSETSPIIPPIGMEIKNAKSGTSNLIFGLILRFEALNVNVEELTLYLELHIFELLFKFLASLQVY